MTTASSRRTARAAALIAAIAALFVFVAQAQAATVLPAGFNEVQVATGFSTPVAVDWTPDGRAFVAEKSGRVRVVNPDGSLRTAPLIDIRDKVNAYSDRGMLGIAVDTDFATNGFVYLLYVVELSPALPDTETPAVSRLTRVKVNPDNSLQNPSNPETVILGTDSSSPCPTPDNTRDCIPADYWWHTIGTVRSDPVDGTLWVGSGDAHGHFIDGTSYRPYDENTYAGKIMHIDRNGNGLPNHPFCPSDANLTHVCTKLYAKGFRNPFRFDLRPGKGPVVGDVGAGDREELDLVKPGENYGWPCYEGSIRTPLYANTTRCAQEYAKEGTAEAATPPSWSYAHTADGASITGGPVYAGANYPAEYRGDIFVGDYVQSWVKRLEIDANDNVTAVNDFATGWLGGVALETMPNGDLSYIGLGWNGSPNGIQRFTYADGNGIPVPRITATPTTGAAPLTVQFNGSTSSDPDGDTLTYDWDFGDGSAHSTAVSPQHVYTTGGTYTARLTVDDGSGRKPSTTTEIQVGGNTAPTATISGPADESTYQAGQSVTLTGSGSDAEDGALSGASLSWQVLLRHGAHLHQIGTYTGPTASFSTELDHDADSHYEITLTATDSGGRTSSRQIEIRPQTSNLTLGSSPTGAPLSYDGKPAAPAPFTTRAGVGYRPTVIAPESFVSGGRTYRFQSWSDGGARQHQVTVGAADATLTANYEADATSTDTLTFTPEADTYVDAGTPTTTYATSSSLAADNDPVKQSFLRFPVSGIAGRKVVGARLRMFQKDASKLGGRVFPLASNTWSESMAFAARPAISGSPVATFGPVVANTWYEVDLGASFVTADGKRSIALDSTSTDGVKWASRHTTTPPQLIVDVETPTGTVVDGLSEVAAPSVGSSEPTYYPTNHRLAVTASGRQLAVHGRSGSGVQLAWRDGAGSWRNTTTGAVTDGQVLSGTGTGSWAASIATARDATGAEHAWVVWSSASSGTTRSVQMRRLTNLESPSGPTVGPVVTVDAPALGSLRADIAFETGLDGQKRGVLLWTRKATSTTHEIVTSWFTNLASDTPALSGSTVLLSGTSSSRYGTLLSAPNGVRALVRGNSSAFKIFGHDRSQPLTTWWQGASGTATPSSSSSSPAGVALASGEMLATAETDLTAHVVKVQRFNAGGAPGAVELQLTGYQQPALTTDGTRAWLVMKRVSDGQIVSRQLGATGWSAVDRVEIGAEGGAMSWPNPLAQADSRLRLIVAGPLSSSSRRSVFGFQRLLGTDTAAPKIASATVSSAPTLAKSVVTYGLTEPARVTFTLQKARRTPRCGKASRRRPAASRRCKARYVKSRTVTRKGRKGKNRVALTMLGGKRLAARRYRLVIVATDRAGNSSRARVVTFGLR